MTKPGPDESVSRETDSLELTSEQMGLLERYAEILSTTGIERGLLGPRELERMWERHILNCAVVALDERSLLPPNSSVVDVGSGAGLPGVVWAIVRPDITVTLVDSLLRRTVFLDEVITELDLSKRVEVVRGRAEDLSGTVLGDITTARAVAPLNRLLPWLAPLTRPGGATLALKGQSAHEELRVHRASVGLSGYKSAEVLQCGQSVIDPPTTLVCLVKKSA